MKKRWFQFLVIAAIPLFVGVTPAAERGRDCEFGDKTYSDGSRYGDYVCEDGRWEQT